MKKIENIIFMGTPEFSVPILEALYNQGYNIQLVVTQPDKPKGRGKKIVPTPVKEKAIELGLAVVQPLSINKEEFINEIKKLDPDVFVVVAFGHILTKKLLDIPSFGSINIHASLLPKYRGPAPIQWAIINGDLETGITTMMMDEGLDTGDILLVEKTAISPDDNAETLFTKLSLIGADIIVKTLKGLESNDITPIKQNYALSSYAPILRKKDGRINWKQPANVIESFIRGMNPWPGAFSFYGEKRLKFFKSIPLNIDSKNTSGTIIKVSSNELIISANESALSILEIQGDSGKRMGIKDFLRGANLKEGVILSD
ncbi:MAG: methionyl-tRNA formyltransferase [Desulfobacterales bacterium]|nr:methionyl-tRNA formyltransferase [Desulfobacterales bacterium]